MESNDKRQQIPLLPPKSSRSVHGTKMAVEGNLKNAVSELLVRRSSDCDLDKLADIAIQNGSPDALRLIMNNFDNKDPEAVNRLLLRACNYKGYPKGRLECLRLILERQDVNIHYTDENGYTALRYAAKFDNREVVLMLLRKGSYIGHTCKNGSPTVAFISSSTLSQYFDECIQAGKEQTGKKYKAEFDYKCLIPYNENERYRNMDVFRYIAGNPRLKHLLKHPLLSMFIHLKWKRIRPLLYVNCFLYFFHYVMLCVYMTHNASEEPPQNWSKTGEVVEPTPKSRKDFFEFFNVAMVQSGFLIWKLLQLIAHTHYYWSKYCTSRSLISCLRKELQYGHLCQYLTNWVEVVMQIIVICVLMDTLPRWCYIVLVLPYGWMLMINAGYGVISVIYAAIYETLCFRFLRLLGIHAVLFSPFVYALVESGVSDKFFIIVVIVFLILLATLAVSDTAEIIGQAEFLNLTSMVKVISYIEIIAMRSPNDCRPTFWLFKLDDILWRRLFELPELRDYEITFELPCASKTNSIIVEMAREIISKKNQESDTESNTDVLKMVNDKIDKLDEKLNSLIMLRDNRSEPGPSGL